MAVRAKFYVTAVDTQYAGQENVTLSAVADTSEDNKAFWEATPAGNLTMCITNPAAQGYFQQGEEYYLDFQQVRPAVNA